jgi:hypothetical protein
VGAIVVPRTVGPRRVGVSTPAIGQSHFGDVEDLVDTDVTFLGLGHGWNDYAAMAVDRSPVRDDFDTVVAKERMHTSTGALLPVSADSWTVECVVRLATPTTPATSHIAWVALQSNTYLQYSSSALRFGYEGSPGTVILTAAPGISAAPSDIYIVCSIEPNPATTDASDAIIRRIRAWNLTTGDYDEASATDAVFVTTGAVVVGAGTVGGGSSWIGDATAQAAIRYVRISKRARTRDELEALLPLVRQWPAPEPLASLGDGLIFRPNMYSLADPVSGIQGVNDGTLYDADTGARDFDDTTDEIRFVGVDGPSDFSCACWVRLHAVSGVQRLFHRRGLVAGSAPVVYLSAGRIGLFWGYDTTNLDTLAASGAAIGSGAWHHLAATRTGDNAADTHLYVDGIEVTKSTATSGAGTEFTASEDWVLGNLLNGTAYLNGLMADPGVWNRVLTPAEVYNLWQSSRTF